MPSLGLKNSVKSSVLSTPGIIRDGLVLKHNYNAGAVVPVSDGAAYFFNLDHIDISAVPMDTDGNCSFVFWAKRNELDTEDAVFGNTGETGLKILRFHNTTTMELESEDGDTATITLNTPNTYDWHHYAIICTSGAVTAYQDGASCSVANPDMGSNTIFDLIGAAGTDGGSKNYQGYLCNVGLWSRAIADTEVKSIMNKNYAGLTGGESFNLISWWNLSEHARDAHGTNHGTVGPE